MTHPKTWPQTEVAAHLEEIPQLAANGEPQHITRPDGVILVVQTQPVNAQPARNGISIYDNFPADTELVTERIKDLPRDIDL